MKRKLLFLILLLPVFLFDGWLPMQPMVLADVATGDGNQSVDFGGSSNIDPGLKSERHFYTDIGGDLDKYLYRDDLQATGGRLTFEINIDRYFSTKISEHVDPITGLLPPNIVTDLVNNKLLPPLATLTLIVFDIDHNAACPEIDHIYVNGLPVYDLQAELVVLVSGNEEWLPVQFEIPIGYLKLPSQIGQNGQRPSALNQIAIDVNTACTNVDWALKVDWGSITIVNPQRLKWSPMSRPKINKNKNPRYLACRDELYPTRVCVAPP